MKKANFLILMLCALSLNTYADAPKTDTEVKASYMRPESKGGPEDQYGNVIRYQEVIINTPSFKVDTFWSRFFTPKDKESEYKNLATSGLFELTTKESFACKAAGLDEKGCSGQKPFLINSGYAANNDLKLDASGADLPAGEYRIPYDSADNYQTTNNDAFYALDVYRAPKYYKKDEAPVGNDKKSFFQVLKSFFKNYFSPAVNTYGDPLDAGQVDAKDRYIANITFGFEHGQRVEKNHPLDQPTINAANSAGNISLLDYNAQTIKTTTSCSGFFLTYNSGSASCKVIGFFGLANWMPFFSNNSKKEINVKSVMQDTEDTLLMLAGNLDDKNYILDKTSVDAQGRRSFLGEIFKPATNMVGSMFRFFFGSSPRTTTEIVTANFDFKNHMPLTFLLTDGAKIMGFDKFQLLGLESVYGTEATSCKVKETSGFFGWGSSYETYTAGIPKTDSPEFELSFLGGFLGGNPDCGDFNQLKNCEVSGWITKRIKIDMNEDDWITWCKRNQGSQEKGIFGKFLAKIGSLKTKLLGTSKYGATYDTQLDNFLSIAKFSVKEYKEKVHRGLILHLKKIENEDIDVGTAGTTTSYKLMSVKKGKKGHQGMGNN